MTFLLSLREAGEDLGWLCMIRLALNIVILHREEGLEGWRPGKGRGAATPGNDCREGRGKGQKYARDNISRIGSLMWGDG